MIDESVRERLHNAVLEYPQCGCALARLARCDDSKIHGNLIQIGMWFGLTPSECCGIMDGWDVAENNDDDPTFTGHFMATRGLGENGEWTVTAVGMAPIAIIESEYEVGRSLGEELYGLVKE